jgi:hypothetical protein
MRKVILTLALAAISTVSVMAYKSLVPNTECGFSVKVDGQTAVQEKGKNFSVIPQPVSPTAKIEIDTKTDSPNYITIIGCDVNGNCSGFALQLFVPKGSDETSLSKILGGCGEGCFVKANENGDISHNASGYYMMSIHADGKTARVRFQVKFDKNKNAFK